MGAMSCPFASAPVFDEERTSEAVGRRFWLWAKKTRCSKEKRTGNAGALWEKKWEQKVRKKLRGKALKMRCESDRQTDLFKGKGTRSTCTR